MPQETLGIDNIAGLGMVLCQGVGTYTITVPRCPGFPQFILVSLQAINPWSGADTVEVRGSGGAQDGQARMQFRQQGGDLNARVCRVFMGDRRHLTVTLVGSADIEIGVFFETLPDATRQLPGGINV